MNSFTAIDTGVPHPIINIAMLTYNHSGFIVDAIESVLMQETSYTYKIIIAEDCSTDDTRSIIEGYQKKYPDKFKLILQNKNVGASQNTIDLLTNLDGKYIAMLEGDDYWVDKLKLQKQIDFLEKNKAVSFCGTNVFKVLEAEDFKNFHIAIDKHPYSKEITVFDILSYQFDPTHTCSMVFRNCLKASELQTPLFKACIDKDRRIRLLLTLQGNGCFINEISAVYRIHNNGISNKPKNTNDLIRGHENAIWKTFMWNKYLDNQYPNAIKKVMHDRSSKLIKLYLKSYNFYSLIKCTDYIDWSRASSKIRLLAGCLKLFRPLLSKEMNYTSFSSIPS